MFTYFELKTKLIIIRYFNNIMTIDDAVMVIYS